MRNYIAEYLGTFMMIFAGTGAMIINDVSGGAITHVGVALTWGMIVAAVIYSIGDISGAHLNPAVTIGFAVAKRFPVKEVAPYIISQLAGAFSASLVLAWLFPEHQTLGATIPTIAAEKALVVELILTLILMFVIMHVAFGAKEKGLMAGAAIGTTVGLEAMFAGPITNASMNPARSIAPAVVSGNLEHLWLYIVATIAGAILAVLVSKYLMKETAS
ncbi:MIP/aquaporin family protein [Kangiella sp. HZ709]|uniref:MIP/aquaporin family protein n=1 Tax=Kangiella sp. HZ709 TaxID=2666328 RepID=UPI0012B04122|nr:aquaporin [Kangiella sp. HZ709]MRX28000.1 aquaporin [Kangiella sp. HZ709]